MGRYQILDRLAVGGMAELFKAQLIGELGFEKLVAIKKILPHLATDKSFVEMFIDEARITAQLDHRHIVQVFELGTDSDTPYIAM
ncbi:MAG TPA: protein kinase, partial [Kofleriaceae bacterium]|nr:protein kinase [Kofleriaceae bacterium]